MKKRSARPPSYEFQEAFIYGGSIVAECEFCGRTHFCDREDAGDFGEGELERLRDERRKDPGKVMGWDCTGLGRGIIDGREFVECCPCQTIRRYEDFIWNHRYEIIRYILARSKRDVQRAQAEAEHLAVAQAILDREQVLYKLQSAIQAADEIEGKPGEGCVPCPEDRYPFDGQTQMCGRLGHGWRYSDEDRKWTHYYGLERAR